MINDIMTAADYNLRIIKIDNETILIQWVIKKIR